MKVSQMQAADSSSPLSARHPALAVEPAGLGTRHSGLLLGAAGVAATLLVACGYQFGVEGPGPTIGGAAQPAAQTKPGEHVPRLSIVNLRNGTFEPNLDIKYSNYLRQEFATGSGAQVVGGTETADYVLKGTILSVLIPTLSFTQTATLESRVETIVMVQAEDVRSHKVVWVQTAKGASEFFITTDLQFNRVLQNRAVEQAGRMVAADLSARFQLFIDDVREGKVKPTEAPPEFIPMLPGAK
ncbi:MAG: LPS assembly lipoprotein LptE [Nitrospiraceae bacterium]